VAVVAEPEDMVGVVMDVMGVAMDTCSRFSTNSNVDIVFHIPEVFILGG
jgi:hypothetical protein